MILHPAFVHFPLALLTMYVLFEIFGTQKFRATVNFIQLQTVLLVAGTVGAFLSAMTGGMLEEMVKDGRVKVSDINVLGIHENFAASVIIIFGIITLSYVAEYIGTTSPDSKIAVLIQNSKIINSFLSKRGTRTAFALLGMIALLCTGALGAVMVYGKDVDPFATFIYNLFF